MATTYTSYEQTTPAAATVPSEDTRAFDIVDQAPFIREIVANGLVMEPTLQAEITSARSFFNGASLLHVDELNANIKYGQEIRVNIEKEQNPLSLYNKGQLEYTTVDSCHNRLDLDCTVPCVNTLPEFEYVMVRFDTEYSYGVKYCDKNKDFWNFDFVTRQYAKSKAGMEFGREVDLWNTAMAAAMASPATTVDALLATEYPTHFWEDGGSVTANGRELVTRAYWYMKNSFGGINPTVFITDEFAHELVLSVETQFNYNTNFQMVNTFKAWDIPGFQISTAVETIFGGNIPVVVMKRSPWLVTLTPEYGGDPAVITSTYPLFDATATQQYVAIFDPRFAYEIERKGWSYTFGPYDCDHLTQTMTDGVYIARGTTFGVYGLVIEFDMPGAE